MKKYHRKSILKESRFGGNGFTVQMNRNSQKLPWMVSLQILGRFVGLQVGRLKKKIYLKNKVNTPSTSAVGPAAIPLGTFPIKTASQGPLSENRPHHKPKFKRSFIGALPTMGIMGLRHIT